MIASRKKLTTEKFNKNSSLIPIIFGITGHRDIVEVDAERAKSCIKKVIRSFRKKYPTTPLVFMSPLADGADCIAARAALESDADISLEIVIPFELREYKKTISSNWLDEFGALMHHERVIEIVICDVVSPNPTNEEERRGLYRKVGEFIAFHSHILFVLKNRENSKNDAGTAEIKDFRKNGCINHNTNAEYKIKCAEEGLLYEIRVRKSSDLNDSVPKNTDDRFYFTPQANDGNSIRSMRAGFALGIVKLASDKCLKKFYKALSNKNNEDLASQNIEILNEKLVTQEINWSIAQMKEFKNIAYSSKGHINFEILAGKFQKKYFFHLNIVFIFALFAAVFQGFDKIIYKIPFLEQHHYLKFSFLVLALFFWGKAKFFRYKDRYESYRAISEALRIQCQWLEAGIIKSPANYFLSNHMDSSSWVRRIVRTFWLFDYSGLQKIATECSIESNTAVHKIRDEWISGQEAYFDKKINTFRDQKLKFDLVINALLLSAIIFFIMSTSVTVHLFNFEELTTSVLESASETFLILFFIAKAYVEMKGLEIFIKRYEISLHLFKQAQIRFKVINSNLAISDKSKLINFRLLLESLGESVLDEVSDWYIANTRMEFKPPGG